MTAGDAAPRAVGRRPGPKPRLSRTQVADAALTVGFDDLTMAAVAAALGMATGALYRYVADRDDLVVAAAERLYAQVPWPEVSGWRALLEAEAWARWEVLTRHPGLVAAVRATGQAIPSGVQRFVRLVDALVAEGFTRDDAVLAADTVLDLIRDGARQHAAIVGAVTPDGPDAWVAEQVRLLGAPFEPAFRTIAGDPRAFMARKIHLTLEGIGSLAPRA